MNHKPILFSTAMVEAILDGRKTVKYLVTFLIFIAGCTIAPKKPDLVLNGREYIFDKKCIKSHTESDYEWHYGYNTWRGKWEWHWGMNTETICDEYKIDTIEINLKEKYYKSREEKGNP